MVAWRRAGPAGMGHGVSGDLLDVGADPALPASRHAGRNAAAVAARAGRVDVLELFRARGFAIELDGDDAFFATSPRGDRTGAFAFIGAEPGIVTRLESSEPGVLARLAGAGNTPAVALALDLGFPLSADALSIAVWRERTDTVRLLLARGAPVSARELSLAQRALTEMSEWTPHHSDEIIDALRSTTA